MGAGRSGSTLLARMLRAHPGIATTAEMAGLRSPKTDREAYPCSCGEPIGKCPFFQELFHRLAMLGLPFDLYRWTTVYALEEDVFNNRRRLLNRLALRGLRHARIEQLRDRVFSMWPARASAIQRTHAVVSAYARECLRMTGRSVFVDASKDPIRARWLADNQELDLRIVHLVRDPRGVCASAVRTYGTNVSREARNWRVNVENCERALKGINRSRWMRLRYEDLVTSPQETVDQIAEFMGLARASPYDWSVGGHHLIGNQMRLRKLAEVSLDERWREELDEAVADRILSLAGLAAKRCGYPLG